jgi:hypothetical protein
LLAPAPICRSLLAIPVHFGQCARVPQPSELVGLFVVEVGERQAWPFVQFCDNSPTPPREVRLYIDTDFEVCHASGADTSTEGLLALNMLAVTRVTEDDGLRVTFDNGSELTVSDAARPTTVGDVWWFSPWL